MARRLTTTARRRGALALAGVIASIAMTIAAPAQAAPNVAKAWGLNSQGQLGDGTSEGPEKCGATMGTPCSTVAIEVSKLSGVKAVAGGEQHAYALLENGTVMAWGNNGAGQLGDGTRNSSDVPVGVCELGYSGPTPCPPENYLKGVIAIAAGEGPGTGVALLENGTVVDWGEMSFAKLGDGATTQSSVPVGVCEVGYSGPTPCPPEHFLKEAKAIAAGSRFALALFGSSGEVAAWGESPLNHGSVFGDGTEAVQSNSVPVAVCAVGEKAPCARNLTGVTAIAIGGAHALAISGGKVVDWGEGNDGALGNGSTEGTNAPVEVQGLSQEATAIAGGQSFSLALLKGGTVEAWGLNQEGQLGTGSTSGPEECGEFHQPCSTKARPGATGLPAVTAIASGRRHSLALLASGVVMAWGTNDDGQLGVGTSTGPENGCGLLHESSCSAKPVEVHGLVSNTVGIAGGTEFSLAFGPPPPAPTNLPELGRCKAVAKGTGQYKGLNCQHLAGGKGNASWTPGAEKNKFEGSSSTTVLATPKLTISCATTILEGEYTGAKTATATLVLKGCTNTATKVKCQSKPGSEGEIESTMPLEGELGFIKGGEKPVVGVDFKKSSTAPNLASFFCATGPEKPELQGTVEGSLIGALKPAGKMAPEYTLAYKGAKGTQTPERFEGGLKDTLAITFTPTGPEPPVTENASLSATLLISNEEPLEIKAVTYPN